MNLQDLPKPYATLAKKRIEEYKQQHPDKNPEVQLKLAEMMNTIKT